MSDRESGLGELDRRLASLSDFLKQLYLAGGIPLVVIGIGAANLFIPYGEAQRWVVSILLIVIGTLAWGASVYAALLRWHVQAKVLAEQDALVLRTVCEIAASQASDVVPTKVAALGRALESVGARLALLAERPAPNDKAPSPPSAPH